MSVSSIKQIAKDLMILQNSGILKSPSLRSSFTASYFSLNPNASAILSESMYSSMNQHLKAVTPDHAYTGFNKEKQSSLNKSTNLLNISKTSGRSSNKSEKINLYTLNQDFKPKIIKKKTSSKLEYIQDIAIRGLRPPTPPTPGEIVITQEPNTVHPPAPPLVIRQQPAKPRTPSPLILREAPPPKPKVDTSRKIITISGKKLPPPPRKVVVERLAPLPCKPQAIIAERWLPYPEVKRRVLFKPAPPDPIVVKPRNIVVQWTPPSVSVKQAVRYLGVVKANPSDYIEKYSDELKLANEFPQVILDIKTPGGYELAANLPQENSTCYKLEGAIDALNLIDLEREGLTDYLTQLVEYNRKKQMCEKLKGGSPSLLRRSKSDDDQNRSHVNLMKNLLIDQICIELDKENTGSMSIKDAERVLSKMSNSLGKTNDLNEIQNMISLLEANSDGLVSLDKFRAVFLKVL